MRGTVHRIGVLGAVGATGLSLGCCAGVMRPLAGVLAAGGLLDGVPVAWRLPLLYGFLALALLGFALGGRRHRRWDPLWLAVAGAGAILVPLHEALDVWVLQVLVWLGLGLLLAAAAWDAGLAVMGRARHDSRTPSRSGEAR